MLGVDLLFYSSENGPNNPDAGIWVSSGVTSSRQGAMYLEGQNIDMCGQPATNYIALQNDVSNTLVISARIKGLCIPLRMQNFPFAPYDYQEVVCTDSYITTMANTGARGMYNPT